MAETVLSPGSLDTQESVGLKCGDADDLREADPRRNGMTKQIRTALVLSGGGAKGAFAAGVVKDLYCRFRETGWFSIVGGTSTGALITPLAALLGGPKSIQTAALEVLTNVYTEVSTSDILRRHSVIQLIQQRDRSNGSSGLRDLIEKHLRPDWFEWLAGKEAPYSYVVYTNYQSGQAVYVSPKDEGVDRKRFINALLASASVPVIMKATLIDGEICYDGGVRDVLPFKRAVDLGAETIVPIFLDPEVSPRNESQFRRLDHVLRRTISILLDETARNDFEQAHYVNVAVNAREEILRAAGSDEEIQQRLRRIFDRSEYRELFGRDKCLRTLITGLRPAEPLTNNELSFDSDQMRAWLTLGEETARSVVRTTPFS